MALCSLDQENNWFLNQGAQSNWAECSALAPRHSLKLMVGVCSCAVGSGWWPLGKGVALRRQAACWLLGATCLLAARWLSGSCIVVARRSCEFHSRWQSAGRAGASASSCAKQNCSELLALAVGAPAGDKANTHSLSAAFLTQTVCLDDTTVKFEIWDTAGQERYHSLAPMYYRGAQAAIVVYDITNTVSAAPGPRVSAGRGASALHPMLLSSLGEFWVWGFCRCLPTGSSVKLS